MDTIREHKDFQFRLLGVDQTNLNRIVRTLEAGGAARDPIRVARVGAALYLVDGFHRLEAYRRMGKPTIPAMVAKMSKTEARDYARASNAMNGKGYSRADKERIWQSFVAEGRHKDTFGNLKKSRAIAADLGGLYSHETVRKKLREMGEEFDEEVEYGGYYEPRTSEEDLEQERAEEAEDSLRTFAALVGTLEPFERDRLLGAARAIVEAVDAEREPNLAEIFGQTGLDI